MSQRKLARALGVSQGALSQWESGKRPFPSARLEKAAAAIGVPVETLIGEDLPAPPRDTGRRLVLRPPYPPGATLEQVCQIGCHQQEVHDRVRARLDDELYRVLEEELPRDTRHELLVAMKLVADSGAIELSSPGHYQCTEHTMHDLDGGIGDHLLQPTVVWERGEERIVAFSQVWLNVLRYGPIRVDFLLCYRRSGRRACWLALEIDDRSSHGEKRYRDEARALALSVPVLRYENHVVHQTWFLGRLLDDIRGLEPEAARRRRNRLERAHRFARQRQERAAERRSVVS